MYSCQELVLITLYQQIRETAKFEKSVRFESSYTLGVFTDNTNEEASISILASFSLERTRAESRDLLSASQFGAQDWGNEIGWLPSIVLPKYDQGTK